VNHARIIYRASDEVLLIGSQRKAALGCAGQIIGCAWIKASKPA